MEGEVGLNVPEDAARNQGYSIVPNLHPCMVRHVSGESACIRVIEYRSLLWQLDIPFNS